MWLGNSSRTFGNKCRLLFFFDCRFVLCVFALIESVTTDTVGNGVPVCHINGKTHIFIDAAALGTVVVGSADHRPLQHKGLLMDAGFSGKGSCFIFQVSHFFTLIL